MKNTIIVATSTALALLFFSQSGYSYDSYELEQLLISNRTLDGNPYRTSGGENVDRLFMVDLILEEIENFNNLIDDYDDPYNPSEGYTWDLKIFHPGEAEGILPSDGGPYPIIIICKGATGGSPELYWYMDWLGSEYAKKGYVVAIPQFIADTSGPPLGFESITDIRVDIYALQVSQTIDYLEDNFLASGLLNLDETTVIGHSYGGYVSLRAAINDQRIARIALLSAYYEDYYELNVLDTYDIMRVLNSLSEEAKPALHVQRYTLDSTGCPGIDPECDPVPVIDGFLMNLSEDPWIPFTGYCDGTTYDCSRGGTFYHYTLYNGPKEDEIKNNPYLSHGGGNFELGRPEVIRLLDNFFDTFPISSANEHPVYSLVETRSTPGFEPPVLYLYGDSDGDGIPDDVDNCPTKPNGPEGGTCSAGTTGDSCTRNSDCGCLGYCSMDQEDTDEDGLGDACDICPYDSDNDADNDGICGDIDNCPTTQNGPAGGSCFNYFTHEVWGECLDHGSCQETSGEWYKWCDTFQGDQDSDGTGDACDTTPTTTIAPTTTSTLLCLEEGESCDANSLCCNGCCCPSTEFPNPVCWPVALCVELDPYVPCLQ
jgi:pimeloyl-ACP methyl ester carboxylesterase